MFVFDIFSPFQCNIKCVFECECLYIHIQMHVYNELRMHPVIHIKCTHNSHTIYAHILVHIHMYKSEWESLPDTGHTEKHISL